MRVAVCLSGEAPRTFGLPCIGLAMTRRLVVPLQADLFVSVNVKDGAKVNETKALFRSTFDAAGVRPRMLHVYKHDGKYATTRACDEGEGQGQPLGRPQAEGFVDCYNHMEPLQYDWIIRQRTDVYVPFTIDRLPSLSSDPSLHYKVFLGFVSKKDWIDDRFAILPGPLSQRAYLSTYASRFCEQSKCRGELCRAPESKLFWILTSVNLTFVDIRYLCLNKQPADLQIVRRDCKETRQRWLHPYDKPPCKLVL